MNAYVENGGSLLATFKTAFANEHVKVSHEVQPRIIKDCLGVKYHQFTFPKNVGLTGKLICEREDAAVTRNHYGKGYGWYVGTKVDETTLDNLLKEFLTVANVEIPDERFPVIMRKGINDFGKCIRYYLNYSSEEQSVINKNKDSEEVLTGESIAAKEAFKIEPWNLRILEEI